MHHDPSDGAFSIYKKKLENFYRERSICNKIRGSRGRPGLTDRERYGTGDNDEKSVNGTRWRFPFTKLSQVQFEGVEGGLAA